MRSCWRLSPSPPGRICQRPPKSWGTEASLVKDLYFDAEGLNDKAVVAELQDHLLRYLHTVIDREWP